MKSRVAEIRFVFHSGVTIVYVNLEVTDPSHVIGGWRTREFPSWNTMQDILMSMDNVPVWQLCERPE